MDNSQYIRLNMMRKDRDRLHKVAYIFGHLYITQEPYDLKLVEYLQKHLEIDEGNTRILELIKQYKS